MKKLIKKYPKIDFTEITEKKIIYFCRDSLSYLSSEKLKLPLEKEILELLKLKDYDWNYKDIDGNNLLLYPIHNNAFSIVSYLLDNKKYDIYNFDKDVARALSSSITYLGEKMVDYILSKNPHPDYINDMALNAYLMIPHVSSDDVKVYYSNLGDKLIENDKKLYNLISHFIENTRDFNKNAETLIHILNVHPLPIQEKIEIVDNLVIKLGINNIKNKNLRNEEKFNVIEKWKSYHYLQAVIDVNEVKVGGKIKI